MIGRAAFSTIDISTQSFRWEAGVRLVAADAAIGSARLIETAAEQAGGSKAALGLGRTKVISGADSVDAFLRIVVAAACSIDVVTYGGAEFAGIWFRDFVDALRFAAFLIGGAAEETLLGLAYGGIREQAGVFGRRASRDAFAVLALIVSGTDGELPGGEAADLSIVGTVAWERN